MRGSLGQSLRFQTRRFGGVLSAENFPQNGPFYQPQATKIDELFNSSVAPCNLSKLELRTSAAAFLQRSHLQLALEQVRELKPMQGCLLAGARANYTSACDLH